MPLCVNNMKYSGGQIFTGPCPVCGGKDFKTTPVLWPELISDWELSPEEVKYIDRQQGCSCNGCGNNLRSMALANAILKSYGFSGILADFTHSELTKHFNLLEINEAGGLTAILADVPKHKLVSYPDYDMTKLNVESGRYDLVVHSDTLEHVDNPLKGLSECGRVLKTTGRCIFTIPIVTDRLSRSRSGLSKSYHGTSNTFDNHLIVNTEFGSDFWQLVLQAGFGFCAVHCLEYPAGIAIEARF